MEQQRRALDYDARERLFARLLSAGFAVFGLYVARELALHGEAWVAGIIASTTILGVAATLVTGRGPRGVNTSREDHDPQ